MIFSFGKHKNFSNNFRIGNFYFLFDLKTGRIEELVFKSKTLIKNFSHFLILNKTQKFYSIKETELCNENDSVSFSVISYKENKYLNIAWKIPKNGELITNFTLDEKNSLIIQMRFFGKKRNPTYPSFSFLLPNTFKAQNRIFALKVKKDLFVRLDIKDFSYLELDDQEILSFKNNDLEMNIKSSFETFAWNKQKLKGYLKTKNKTLSLKKIYQLGKKLPNHQTMKITIKEKHD